MADPVPFASVDQAASYGYDLPADAAAGLLARASQAVRDAAGFGILSEPVTITRGADRGRLDLPVPLITAVTSVSADGTVLEGDAWRWIREPRKVAGDRILLGHAVRGRRDGEFTVNLTHGLASVPDSLVTLTASVAYRLAATPAPMLAGITSQTVGAVSWSAAGSPPGDELTAAEESRLARIVPVRRVWAVRA